MHICFIATTSHVSSAQSDGIGASTHVYELARSFVRLGHTVTVISELKDSSEPIKEYTDGFTIIRMSRNIPHTLRKNPSFFVRLLRPLKFFSILMLAFRTAQYCRNHDVDVLAERAQSLGVGAYTSLFIGKPLYLEVIDDQWSWISILLAKKIFAYTKCFFPSMIHKKVTIVHAGVNSDIFKPVRHRKQYDIGFVGAFKSWEGLEDLCKAIHILKKRGIVVRAILIGEGEFSKTIMNHIDRMGISQQVKCIGKVRIHDVSTYLSQSRIGVAPYFVDRMKKGKFNQFGFYFSPLKVVEYMACGLPVVASDYPLISYLLSPSKYGLVCTPGDSNDLADTIEKALKRRWDSKDIRNHALSFSWDALATTMERVMQKDSQVSECLKDQ